MVCMEITSAVHHDDHFKCFQRVAWMKLALLTGHLPMSRVHQETQSFTNLLSYSIVVQALKNSFIGYKKTTN